MKAKLSPKAQEILRQSETPKTFTWLMKNVVNSPTHLSNLLAQLCELGYLVKNVRPRGYQTTQQGRNFLSENANADEAAAASLRTHLKVPLDIELPQGMQKPDYSMSISYDPVPFLPPKQETTIEGYLYIDDAHNKKFNEIIKEFKRKNGMDCIASLFRILSEAVSSVYGYPNKSIQLWWDNPLKLKDLLMKTKTSLDYNAGVVLRLDGRTIADKVPWGKELKAAAEQERREKQIWKRQKQAIIGKKDFRVAWLEEVVKLDLEHKMVQADMARRSGVIADSREELEKMFIEGIREQKGQFPRTGYVKPKYHVPSDQDVRDTLGSLEEEGVFRIVEKCVLEIDRERLELSKSKINLLFRKMFLEG